MYLTLSGSLMPCDNLPVRFRLPGKSGIKQREYFLMIFLCNNTPTGSRNLSVFGNGMRGIWVIYIEVTLLFHSPNRLSLITISTAYSAIIFFSLLCSAIIWYRRTGILNSRKKYCGSTRE